jgi:hypothetical protein
VHRRGGRHLPAAPVRRRGKSGPPALDSRSAVAWGDPYDSQESFRLTASSHGHNDRCGAGARCASGTDLPAIDDHGAHKSLAARVAHRADERFSEPDRRRGRTVVTRSPVAAPETLGSGSPRQRLAARSRSQVLRSGQSSLSAELPPLVWLSGFHSGSPFVPGSAQDAGNADRPHSECRRCESNRNS